jgi:hypothetical protein
MVKNKGGTAENTTATDSILNVQKTTPGDFTIISPLGFWWGKVKKDIKEYTQGEVYIILIIPSLNILSNPRISYT